MDHARLRLRAINARHSLSVGSLAPVSEDSPGSGFGRDVHLFAEGVDDERPCPFARILRHPAPCAPPSIESSRTGMRNSPSAHPSTPSVVARAPCRPHRPTNPALHGTNVVIMLAAAIAYVRGPWAPRSIVFVFAEGGNDASSRSSSTSPAPSSPSPHSASAIPIPTGAPAARLRNTGCRAPCPCGSPHAPMMSMRRLARARAVRVAVAPRGQDPMRPPRARTSNEPCLCAFALA